MVDVLLNPFTSPTPCGEITMLQKQSGDLMEGKLGVPPQNVLVALVLAARGGGLRRT